MKELAKRYAELKAQEKAIQTEIKGVQSEVKEYLNSNNLSALEYDGGKLDYRTSESITVDEKALMDYIKKQAFEARISGIDAHAERLEDCMEYVITLNEEKVEELIYDGILTIEEIAHCYTTKITKSLYVKRDKKK